MTGHRRIVFQLRAEEDAARIDRWWRAHRQDARDLFVTELEQAVEGVALAPTLGTPAASRRFLDVRRVLMRKTGYHVYYRVHEDALEVLAVWHAARASGPGV